MYGNLGAVVSYDDIDFNDVDTLINTTPDLIEIWVQPEFYTENSVLLESMAQRAFDRGTNVRIYLDD